MSGNSKKAVLRDSYDEQLTNAKTTGERLEKWIQIAYDASIVSGLFAIACAIFALSSGFSPVELSQFLQGTSGVLLTFATVLLLTGGMLGTQKQLILSQSQAALQHLDFALKTISDDDARRLAIIDRALELRLALLSPNSADVGNRTTPLISIQSYLKWVSPYLSKCVTLAELRTESARFAESPQFFDSAYITHLRGVFHRAAEANEIGGLPWFTDHVWAQLYLEERALAVVLRIVDPKIAPPSRELFDTWESALSKVVPWDPIKVPVQEALG